MKRVTESFDDVQPDRLSLSVLFSRILVALANNRTDTQWLRLQRTNGIKKSPACFCSDKEKTGEIGQDELISLSKTISKWQPSRFHQIEYICICGPFGLLNELRPIRLLLQWHSEKWKVEHDRYKLPSTDNDVVMFRTKQIPLVLALNC